MGAPRGTRITGGSLRGETVRVIPGRTVRPMRGRVREALFAILGRTIAGAQVLDAFAGSGSLGAEAISRGAAFVTFVDRDPRVLRILEENRRRLGLAAQSEVLSLDLTRAVPPTQTPYDIVLLDPPFPDFGASDARRDPWKVVERLVSKCLCEGGRVALEHPRGLEPPEGMGITWEEARNYGESDLRLGVKSESESESDSDPDPDSESDS